MAQFSRDSQADGLAAVHLEGSEAQRIGAGQIQRAELATLLIEDLSAEATVISEGILPPDIISSTLGWSTPLSGRPLGDMENVALTCLEIVRNADGSFTVLADRTSLPYGLGILAATGTDGPFGEFMELLRGEIARRGEGRGVLLYDPSSFNSDPSISSEVRDVDANWAARALGLPLVGPAELRMHGNEVLDADGEVVRFALRYLPVRSLDPLEPRAVGNAGIPGLAAALRSGTFRMVNPPTAVVNNNPALATFLPKIARHFLGQDLLLPPVATYWCGDRAMCSHTIAGVSRLIVRSISRPEVYDGRKLSMAECAELCARISDEPWDWVGQEPVEPDVVEHPDGTIAPLMVRAFTVRDKNRWVAMRGGLAFLGGLYNEERILVPAIMGDEP